jgi:hypothetical protein
VASHVLQRQRRENPLSSRPAFPLFARTAYVLSFLIWVAYAYSISCAANGSTGVLVYVTYRPMIVLLFGAIGVLQVIHSSSLHNFRRIYFIFGFVIAISSSSSSRPPSFYPLVYSTNGTSCTIRGEQEIA